PQPGNAAHRAGGGLRRRQPARPLQRFGRDGLPALRRANRVRGGGRCRFREGPAHAAADRDMNREFLDYYNRELKFLYERSKEFAEEFPGVAERLGGLIEDKMDPGLAGLLEG